MPSPHAATLLASPSLLRSARALTFTLACLFTLHALLAHAQPADPPVPAPDTPPAPTTPSPATPPPDASASLQTNLRMRELSGQVDELKEETFAAKSRLLLLRASVLQRSVAGSKLIVLHQDDMGAEYTPAQVSYALNRERKLNRVGAEDIHALHEQVVIDEKIFPGSHILTVRMVYKGAPWGVFQYMNGYTFTLESNYAFTAEEGKVHEITVRAFEQGGVFTPYEERPTITYQVKTHKLEASTVAPSP